MKIATYNVNGVNGRLPVLLRWLKEAKPDIVCLQELKAPQEKFPIADIRKAGYGAIWNGQKSWNGVAILARGADPVETRRGLPGAPDDLHSRYIEAAVNGLIVGCLYLPNGNPAPGPKFDYKLEWFERLTKYAKKLLASGAPAILAGDYNVMPTDLDVYKPERWLDDALFRPEVKSAYAKLVKQGWTDALRKLHPDERIYTFWDYFRNAYARDAGLRIDHFLLSPALAKRLQDAKVDREVRGWEKTSDHAPVWVELADGKKQRGVPMASDAARDLLLYVVLPLWILAGFADYLCHRTLRIEQANGIRETLLHWLMQAEVGSALLAATFLHIDAAVLIFMFICLVAHEITTHFDLKLANATRLVPPVEQQIHSLLEILPFTALALLAVLKWPEATAILGYGNPDYSIRLAPFPGWPSIGIGASALAIFGIIPYLEEFVRGYRAEKRRSAERS